MDKKEINKMFGKALRHLRYTKFRWRSMEEFEKATGINRALMYKYEKGTAFPPIDTFIKLCEIFGKSPDYFLTRFFQRPPVNPRYLELVDEFEELFNNPDQEWVLETILQVLRGYKHSVECEVCQGTLESRKKVNDSTELNVMPEKTTGQEDTIQPKKQHEPERH